MDDPELRALTLLNSFLTEQQREELRTYGGFRYQDGYRLYWIPLGPAPISVDLAEKAAYTFCLKVKDGDALPNADRALTYLTWIRFARHEFSSEANVMARHEMPDLEGEEAFLNWLAVLAGSGRAIGTGASPYQILVPEPEPTEEQRHAGLAKAQELKTAFRRQVLKDRLALVDLGDQKILDKLIDSWPFEKDFSAW